MTSIAELGLSYEMISTFAWQNMAAEDWAQYGAILFPDYSCSFSYSLHSFHLLVSKRSVKEKAREMEIDREKLLVLLLLVSCIALNDSVSLAAFLYCSLLSGSYALPPLSLSL